MRCHSADYLFDFLWICFQDESDALGFSTKQCPCDPPARGLWQCQSKCCTWFADGSLYSKHICKITCYIFGFGIVFIFSYATIHSFQFEISSRHGTIHQIINMYQVRFFMETGICIIRPKNYGFVVGNPATTHILSLD